MPAAIPVSRRRLALSRKPLAWKWLAARDLLRPGQPTARLRPLEGGNFYNRPEASRGHIESLAVFSPAETWQCRFWHTTCDGVFGAGSAWGRRYCARRNVGIVAGRTLEGLSSALPDRLDDQNNSSNPDRECGVADVACLN